MLSNLMKNKTHILNAITVLAGVAGYLAGNEVIVAHPEIAAGLLSAVGVLNIIARMFTVIPSTPAK